MNHNQTSNEIIERVKGLVVATTELPMSAADIDDHASLFDDCGFDSMSIVKLVLAVEQAFAISIDDGDVTETTFQSPATLAQWIVARSRDIEIHEVQHR